MAELGGGNIRKSGRSQPRWESARVKRRTDDGDERNSLIVVIVPRLKPASFRNGIDAETTQLYFHTVDYDPFIKNHLATQALKFRAYCGASLVTQLLRKKRHRNPLSLSCG